MTIQYDLTTLYDRVTTLLQAEETATPVRCLSEWQTRQAQRAELGSALGHLERSVAELCHRYDMLAHLPRALLVSWAQTVLAFPNLAFLEVDTDGLSTEADLLRITLIDRSGALLFDQLIQPRRPLTSKIVQLTGLTPEHLVTAPRLADVWKAVQQALAGRYLLSFNLAFDEQQLAANARRHNLPPLTLIGECLMLRAQEYYAEASYPRLSALCERLGFPLPEHPEQDALHRARAQLHLLETMAQGTTSLTPSPVPQEVHEVGEVSDERDPFLPDFPDELA
jgi:DNA polymerase III epsilon subunit-like protein